MQFKHPEILFALLLLIIPIIVHLFQLQRFVKVPFTNVKFLKKIALETRKSSQLKKWLILATRMLLFSALILAFSQPYFSNKNSGIKTHTIIYLDNSLSLSYKNNQQEIFKKSTQDLISNLPSTESVSLFTNDQTFENINTIDLKNELLKLTYSSKEIDFSEILLKVNQLKSNETNTLNKIILISDFELNKNISERDVTNVNSSTSIINSAFEALDNFYIDSVFISDKNSQEINLTAIIKSAKPTNKNISISLFSNSELVGKATTPFDENSESIATFKIPFRQNIEGKLIIGEDNLTFDNSLFFTISKPSKIKVFSIGKSSSFLSRIYTQDEFNFQQNSTTNLNYEIIPNQHLIILNELEEIPLNLQNSLKLFYENGGSITLIPSENNNLNSYNNFLSLLKLGSITSKTQNELEITSINFDHPFFNNVFEDEIKNFQYPTANQYFNTLFNSESPIILFENQKPFLSLIGANHGNVFWINTPLNISTSNFQNSPLIVPVFYNFGILSHQPTNLYYNLGTDTSIDIPINIKNDDILKIKNETTEFIPLQRVYNNRVRLFLNNQPTNSNFYDVTNNDSIVKTIAFNYNRLESDLRHTDIHEVFNGNKNISISQSIEETFTKLNEQQEIKSLFKWFLALSIVFLLLEICILKYYKV